MDNKVLLELRDTLHSHWMDNSLRTLHGGCYAVMNKSTADSLIEIMDKDHFVFCDQLSGLKIFVDHASLWIKNYELKANQRNLRTYICTWSRGGPAFFLFLANGVYGLVMLNDKFKHGVIAPLTLPPK